MSGNFMGMKKKLLSLVIAGSLATGAAVSAPEADAQAQSGLSTAIAVIAGTAAIVGLGVAASSAMDNTAVPPQPEPEQPPVPEEPVEEQPAVEQPAVEQPVVEQPVAPAQPAAPIETPRQPVQSVQSGATEKTPLVPAYI